MATKVAVIGAGSWGTAVAVVYVEVAAVVNGTKTAAEIIPALMMREAKSELDGISPAADE